MHSNHLMDEKSPYLLQHAHNPVDWYPWCPEAFERAREEEKPVFLSIGYSTCHWCHVMERESFEDTAVARVLNRSYISIKVDREERPDVDGVYMEACQMMNGSGGWPLTVLMTADQEPFFVGTYFPKESRYGQVGLLHLLEQTAERWEKDPRKLKKLAGELAGYLRQQEMGPENKWEFGQQARTASNPLIREYLKRGAHQLARMFDQTYGGFSGAPKFPMPHNLLFLMRLAEAARMEKEPKRGMEPERWMRMVELTLRQMYRGGIFDHVGGGFSRYSTDECWLAPHFEKMLYDNALLSLAYLEAFRLTGETFYSRVAQRTLFYVETELTHEKGGFFCGQDADSEGVEGKYYLWTPKEVEDVLGKERGRAYCSWYDITPEGNFEGKSIPNLGKESEYEAVALKAEESASLLADYRRRQRKLPKDDKILTSWNGLAIWAFVRAYQVLGITSYYKQAKKAASFIRANLMTLNGRLKVRWREGHVAHEGNLDDYAFYALSLLELYQCDFDISWLRTCLKLAEKMVELFEDPQKGGYFFSGTAGETLISRPKEVYDGAVPSGNSVAGYLMVRLAKLTKDPFWEEAARRQVNFLMEEVKGREGSHTMALLALLEQAVEGIHLVCVTEEDVPEEEIRCYRKKEQETVHAIVLTEKNRKSIEKLIPHMAGYPRQKNPHYYVCRGRVCGPPVTELPGRP